MTLKKVVLPAPFGPISAVIDPSRIERLARFTARIPPKRLITPSASKIRPSAGAPRGSFTEHHLLAPAEEPLRAEGHQPDEDEADDDEAQRSDSRLRERQLDEAQSLEHEPEDHGAERHTPIVREAAEDQHGVAAEGDDRKELVGNDESQVEGEEEPRDRPQRGGDGERLELVGERVLPESPSGILVLAHRPQDAAPGRVLDSVQREGERHRHDPDDDEERKQGRDIRPAEVREPALDRLRDRIP